MRKRVLAIIEKDLIALKDKLNQAYKDLHVVDVQILDETKAIVFYTPGVCVDCMSLLLPGEVEVCKSCESKEKEEC